MKWYGKSTKGVKPAFIRKVVAAATAQGAVGIYVYSGKRTPATNTGVSNSNHLYGHALDGYAILKDGSKVPLGTLLKGVAGNYGLRSGDVPGFYKGGPDPNHVDDGYNVGGAHDAPQGTPPTTATTSPPTQPDGTTQTISTQGNDVSAQLSSAVADINQVGVAPPLASPPLAGESSYTALTPQRTGETWQLIASQGNVSPDTIRLAQLASYGDGSSG